jgi:hypothetical protein
MMMAATMAGEMEATSAYIPVYIHTKSSSTGQSSSPCEYCVDAVAVGHYISF